MHILEALWNGNISPISQSNYRMEEQRELMLLYEQNQGRLLPTLNDTQREDLQKMKDLTEEMQSIAECSAFMNGFRLAVQLMSVSVTEDR